MDTSKKGMADEHPYEHPTGEQFQAQLPLRSRTHETRPLLGTGDVVRTPPTCPFHPSQTCIRLTDLPHDVLDPIVGFVAENRKHLLNLCQASVVLYMNCIPWIYRHVVINFSDPESYALLQRLCYTVSQIPTYVRFVALMACGQASEYQWALFVQALSRFTRLRNLRWDSHVSIPSIQAYIKQVYDGYRYIGT
jgi:hypothetical protein